VEKNSHLKWGTREKGKGKKREEKGRKGREKLKKKQPLSERLTPFTKKKEVIKAEKVPVVFCSDLNGFVDKVTELRDLPNQESLVIKFSVNEGQNLLKIGVSIIHLLAHLPGHQSKQKYLDSGVFKGFVIAVTPGKETYDNLVVFFEKAGFRDFKHPFVIPADLKAVAALVGTSSAGSATYPCPGCLWDRRIGVERRGELRNFGMCIETYQRWMNETGGKTVWTRTTLTVNSCHSQSTPVQRPSSLMSSCSLEFMFFKASSITCSRNWKRLFLEWRSGRGVFIRSAKNTITKF
jgi:hypothetical protein